MVESANFSRDNRLCIVCKMGDNRLSVWDNRLWSFLAYQHNQLCFDNRLCDVCETGHNRLCVWDNRLCVWDNRLWSFLAYQHNRLCIDNRLSSLCKWCHNRLCSWIFEIKLFVNLFVFWYFQVCWSSYKASYCCCWVLIFRF